MNSAKIFNPSLYLLMGKGQVPLATGGRAGLGAQEPGKDRQTDRPPRPILSGERDAQSTGKPGRPFIAIQVEASFFLGCINYCSRSHTQSLTL